MPLLKSYKKIEYPRKCDHCDYFSNNPQMWHYHKKTHDPIPEGQMCGHGCGKPALFRGTGGKYTCMKVSQHCPEYIKQHSERIKSQWHYADERKKATKKSFIERLHNKETIEKQIKTKREKFGTLDPERAKDYRHYARFVRQRAQSWAIKQGYILGQQTYHIDHKLSVLDAWKLNLPEHIVNHPANLQILEAKENSSKGSKSIITIEELYKLIKKWNYN